MTALFSPTLCGCRERLSEDFAVRQAPRRHMDKAYDHENSEVLLCKLRRANNKEGGRGDVRGKSDGSEGKKEGVSCVVAGGAAGAAVCAAGAGDNEEGGGSAVGAKILSSDRGVAVGITSGPGLATTEAAAEEASTAADGLSLAGVSVSPSLPWSVAHESVDANGSSPNEGAVLTAVTGSNPLRQGGGLQ